MIILSLHPLAEKLYLVLEIMRTLLDAAVEMTTGPAKRG